MLVEPSTCPETCSNGATVNRKPFPVPWTEVEPAVALYCLKSKLRPPGWKLAESVGSVAYTSQRPLGVDSGPLLPATRNVPTLPVRPATVMASPVTPDSNRVDEPRSTVLPCSRVRPACTETLSPSVPACSELPRKVSGDEPRCRVRPEKPSPNCTVPAVSTVNSLGAPNKELVRLTPPLLVSRVGSASGTSRSSEASNSWPVPLINRLPAALASKALLIKVTAPPSPRMVMPALSVTHTSPWMPTESLNMPDLSSDRPVMRRYRLGSATNARRVSAPRTAPNCWLPPPSRAVGPSAKALPDSKTTPTEVPSLLPDPLMRLVPSMVMRSSARSVPATFTPY